MNRGKINLKSFMSIFYWILRMSFKKSTRKVKKSNINKEVIEHLKETERRMKEKIKKYKEKEAK